jgi:membrane protease YdiL (CAAX protease family)
MTVETTVPAVRSRHSWRNPLTFLAFTAVSLFAYVFLSSLFSHTRATADSFFLALPPLLLTLALIAMNVRFIRREGWPLAVIGFARPSRQILLFALGLLLGAALILVWAVIVTVCTGSSWHAANTFSLRGAAMVLALTFLVNFSEELAYRGYLFVRLARGAGSPAAILITSTVFFLYHVQSGVPWLSALAGVFTCGLIYAVLVARVHSVPLALGFHWANNLAQHVLGLRDSALTLFHPTASGSPSSGIAILVCVGLANLAVAAGVYFGFSARKAA